MIKYIIKNLKLSKKLYFPLFMFSLIMSLLISLAVFLYNSTKENAVSYAKIMGDLDIGIFYENKNRDDFYKAIKNIDLDKCNIEKIIEVPMILGDLSINGIIKKENAIPLSYLKKVSKAPLNISLENGEILVSENQKNIKKGDSTTFLYQNFNKEICSTSYVVKDKFYINDILQTSIVLPDAAFNKIWQNQSPYYFSVYLKNDKASLVSQSDYNYTYQKLTEELKDFNNKDYFISFFSKSNYDQISKFIYLVEASIATVIIIILLLEFSLSISIFISLLESRKTDLGMFKAFGMSNKKLSCMFFIEVFITSFIGTVIGILISLIIAYFAKFISFNVNNYIMKIVSEQLKNLTAYFNYKNIALPLLFSNIMPSLIYFLYEKRQINKNIQTLINNRS